MKTLALVIPLIALSNGPASAAEAFAQTFKFDSSGSIPIASSMSFASGATASAAAGTDAFGQVYSEAWQNELGGSVERGLTFTSSTADPQLNPLQAIRSYTTNIQSSVD